MRALRWTRPRSPWATPPRSHTGVVHLVSPPCYALWRVPASWTPLIGSPSRADHLEGGDGQSATSPYKTQGSCQPLTPFLPEKGGREHHGGEEEPPCRTCPAHHSVDVHRTHVCSVSPESLQHPPAARIEPQLTVIHHKHPGTFAMPHGATQPAHPARLRAQARSMSSTHRRELFFDRSPGPPGPVQPPQGSAPARMPRSRSVTSTCLPPEALDATGKPYPRISSGNETCLSSGLRAASHLEFSPSRVTAPPSRPQRWGASSWRTMDCSRPGPTPIAEIRQPESFSRAST